MGTILEGDALEILKTLPDESVHTCVTSPPYYNLRDYGCAGQIGMERTPEEYIDKLVEVFQEVRRVLRSEGTLWLNIGDSYATRSGPQAPGNTRNSSGHTEKRVPTGYKYKAEGHHRASWNTGQCPRCAIYVCCRNNARGWVDCLGKTIVRKIPAR